MWQSFYYFIWLNKYSYKNIYCVSRYGRFINLNKVYLLSFSLIGIIEKFLNWRFIMSNRVVIITSICRKHVALCIVCSVNCMDFKPVVDIVSTFYWFQLSYCYSILEFFTLPHICLLMTQFYILFWAVNKNLVSQCIEKHPYKRPQWRLR